MIGNLTIDHTILPGAEQELIVNGGNALYAALGSWSWGATTSMVTCLGRDYDKSLLEDWRCLGIGIEWIIDRDLPSLRGKLTYDESGARDWEEVAVFDNDTSVDSMRARHELLSPEPSPQLLKALRNAAGVHIAPMPSRLQKAFLTGLEDSSCYVTLDPHPMLMEELARGPIPALRRVDAFLPSQDEAAFLIDAMAGSIGVQDAIVAARALSDLGPVVVGIKLGKDGVVVYDRDTEHGFHLPAEDVAAVDPTGAGDSFCGAWLASASSGEPVRLAAERAVSTAARTVSAVGTRALETHRGAQISIASESGR